MKGEKSIFCILTGFSIIMSSQLFSCGHRDTADKYDLAGQLFRKSVNIIKVYIDSISCASDSAALRSITVNFNNKLTALNFEFPADTDLTLNEEENDSLIHMLERFGRAKQQRDSILSVKNQKDSTVAEVSKAYSAPVQKYKQELKNSKDSLPSMTE